MEGTECQIQWRGESVNQENDRRLIGRVISNTKVPMGAVREQVGVAWKLKKGFEIIVLGFNLFEFIFEGTEEVQRVLEGSPWVVRQHMLTLEKRKPYLSDSEIQVKTCAFWIQLHDIPPEGKMEINVRTIASKVGRVIAVDNPEDPRFRARSFCRARVEIDTEKALVPMFKIPRPDGLKDAHVKVKYEKLAKFCFICGKLGHDDRSCVIEEEDDPTNEPKRSFDANMCGQPVRSVQPSMVRGSSSRSVPEKKGVGEQRREVCVSGDVCMSEGHGSPSKENEERLEGVTVGKDYQPKLLMGGDSGKSKDCSGAPHSEKSKWNMELAELGSQQILDNVIGYVMGLNNPFLRKGGQGLGPNDLSCWPKERGLERVESDLIKRKKGKNVMGEIKGGDVDNETREISDLVQRVERVNLKRNAEQNWTSPSGKRRKVHEKDSPGFSGIRQTAEGELERWSRAGFQKGKYESSRRSVQEEVEFSAEEIQIDVQEGYAFIEGKRIEKVSKFKYRSSKIKRALFTENVVEKMEGCGGWPSTATKEL